MFTPRVRQSAYRPKLVSHRVRRKLSRTERVAARWSLILACVLIAVGAAAGLTIQVTPEYASTVRLFASILGAPATPADPVSPQPARNVGLAGSSSSRER